MTYSVPAYSRMLADRVRITAYREALRRSIRGGETVVDIGAGTGILTLFACQLGAGRVVAIEPADVIEIARRAVADNGFADRVTFFRELSTSVTIPEPADVLVSDIRGVLPLFREHVPAIRDARARLLRPGGIQIPARDSLWAAVVECPDYWREQVRPWEEDFGLDLGSIARLQANHWSRTWFEPDRLVTEPALVAELDYRTIENPSLAAEVAWTAARSATAHGIALWFDAELVEGVGFSNRPGAARAIYGQGFFPLTEPVPVEPGDRVELRLRATPAAPDYMWSWSTTFARDGAPTAAFRQSTFLGTLTPVNRLQEGRSPAGLE